VPRGRGNRIPGYRPEVLNAVSPVTNFELDDAFNAFEFDDDLWVAIITAVNGMAFGGGFESAGC
jgi:enoyl-CoA hydratase/carnithine racemase